MAIARPNIARSRRLPVVSPNRVIVDRVDLLRSGQIPSAIDGRGTRLAGLAPKSDNAAFRCTLGLGMLSGYGCNGTSRYPTLGPGQAACHGLSPSARGELQISCGHALGRGSSHKPSPSGHRNRQSPCRPAMFLPTIQAASYGSPFCSTSHPAYVPVPFLPDPEYGAVRCLTPRPRCWRVFPTPPPQAPASQATAKPA